MIIKIKTSLVFLLSAVLYGQVGIGTATPNSSAALHISASNKGFLLPRVNLTGRNDISTIPSPAAGLMVVNLTASGTAGNAVIPNSIYFWQGSVWQKFTTLTEVTSFTQSGQYVIRSTATQPLTATQLNNINTDENFEVPVVWAANEVTVDNPADIEMLPGGNEFRLKITGDYVVVANFSFNPLRSVTADNSNYTYTAFTVMKSADNGTTWTPVSGTATPYDIGVSNQLQTVILPRTILRFNSNDRIKVVITQPGSTTPDYGTNAGILKKANEDFTKYLRIRRIYNN